MSDDDTIAEILRRMDERDARWGEEREERDARWEEQRDEARRHTDVLLERHAALTQELIVAFREMREEFAEQRDQTRANTEATWRMLDRFGEGPATA